MKNAIGSGLLAIAYPFWFFGKADDQLLRLNINACDPGINDVSFVNRLGQFEGLSNRFDDQRLDISCRHSAHRSDVFGCALEEGRRQIVSVFHVALAGMAWSHAVAAIVEDTADQKSLGLHPFGLMVGDLLIQPRL